MALNKYIEKLLDKLYYSKHIEVIEKFFKVIYYFLWGLFAIYCLIYLCKFAGIIYKPKDVECVDITFVSPAIDSQQQDFMRKKMLGAHATLSWYDKDVRLDMHNTNNTSESIIFTGFGGGYFKHDGLDDSMTLLAHRNFWGWISYIELSYFNFENNKYSLLYTVKLE